MSGSAPNDPFASFSGTARFEIIRKLGSGGMGTVYEALDRDRGTRVAIKTVGVREPELLLRLKREFRSLQDISSSHLVRYGELIQDAGAWFFTMELIEGTTFLRYVAPSSREADPRLDDETPTSMAAAMGATAVRGQVGGDAPAAAARYDEVRLRQALVQLARALMTLHAHQKVHRDVKPANVLVTSAGRVVLVDFGLVLDSSAIVRSVAQGVQGTVAYMAPEQASVADVGPPADWYAFGVMLYEALVGRLPFRGLAMQVLNQKLHERPIPPLALIASVPADLDQLCMALLATDPAERPTGAEVLARLATGAVQQIAEAAVTAAPPPTAEAAAPFVGRRPELADLRAAFDETRRGSAVVAIVRGESGVGKTALVRRFTERMVADHPETVVLEGRCYERESVPYKALDSVIDALAGYLQRLPQVEAAALRPRRASALLQVFPVLGRVPVLRDAPKFEIADPQELRRRAFEALRELFEKLCEGQPVVVLVDDFHWADADSLHLLAELLAPPSAPPLLVIGTWRTEVNAKDRQLAITEGIRVRELELGRLAPDEAGELATTLLRLYAAPVAARVAKEAGGHPLFIGELARAAADPETPREGATLETVLWRRVQGLDTDARRLTEALSIGEVPVRHEALALASGLSREAFERAAARLQADHIARAASERGGGFLDVYHSRVRDAVRAHLSGAEAIAWHTRLAAALESIEPDAHEALAIHHLGAGAVIQGIAHAINAAERADRALAFDQAARLYEMALGVLPAGDPRRSSLSERLGLSLANAGRGLAAAQALRSAMADASPSQALDLRWRIAEQLVRCGHIDEGLDETRTVLTAHRLPFPRTGLGALTRLLSRRAQIALRLRLPRSMTARRDAVLEQRVDICWSAALLLAYIDSVRGALLQAEGLLTALRLGDPNRLARAFLTEAGYLAAGGAKSDSGSVRMMAMAKSLVVPGVDPLTDAWVPHMSGIIAYLQGRWTDAVADLVMAQDILQSQCAGATWDLAALWFILAQTLAYAGRLNETSRLVHACIRLGSERGDRYLTAMARSGYQGIVWLAADDPAAARGQTATAVAEWSQRQFHMLHYNAALADANVDLYEGEPARGLDRIDGVWSAIRHAMIFEFAFCRIEMGEMRARAAVAAGAAALDPDARRGYFRRAARDLGRIEREHAPWGQALARTLRACLASQEGRRADAIAGLEAGVRLLDDVNMGLHAASARWMLAALAPDRFAVARDAAQVYFDREQVRNPARLAATLVPALAR